MITIIGVGALGSHVAQFLRNEKAGLKVVDFDRIEAKNVQAQFHSAMRLGYNKADAIQNVMRGLFRVAVSSCPYKMVEDNARIVLKDSTLVLDCTDNLKSRNIISSYCKELTLPLLHGAMSASGDFARIIWDEHFIADHEGDDTAATCVDGEHLPFFAAASAFMSIEAQNFLKTGKKRSWQLTPSGILRLS
jgi:molybdopterin/thiamine biosynthesis adenylyltransferase